MNQPVLFTEPYERIQAINWSTLKLIADSPRALQYRADHEQEDTEWLLMGRAIHCKALEPERFAERFVVEPYFGSQATKIGKANKAAWECDIGGRDVLPHKQGVTLEACSRALAEHPLAPGLLAGKHERIVTWTDPETGIPCKGRLDVTNRRVVDLKSTSCGSMRHILNEAADRLYHGQVAWYHDGATHAGDVFDSLPAAVFVQTVAPFDVVVLDMDLEPGTFDSGQLLYRRLLEEYQGCKATDWWPGMAPAAVPWTLPPWHKEDL